LTEQPNQMTVHVKHGNLEETISGSPEQVWLLLNKFFSNILPSFETAKRLTLQVDLQTIIKESDGMIAFSEMRSNLYATRESNLRCSTSKN
jgi:hypothetical protein